MVVASEKKVMKGCIEVAVLGAMQSKKKMAAFWRLWSLLMMPNVSHVVIWVVVFYERLNLGTK